MLLLPSRLFALLFQVYLLLLVPLFLESVSLSPHRIPRLSPHKHALILKDSDKISSASATSEDFKTYFYSETLDHFNYAPQSYATFQQRYVVSSRFWGGANSNSPIFAYLGAEGPLDQDLDIIGFIRHTARFFKHLAVFIEHRFYGKSVPFGSMEEAMRNKTLRGYFNSAQAIADYAEVLLHVKEKFSAHNSPIIVIGGSYGGMLASWFRLKYPHIALGALASSAPILYFDNITPQNGYYSIVPEDFKDYLDWLYSNAAQYNLRPIDSVRKLCNGIDGAPRGTDVLGRIFAGIVSSLGNLPCYDTNAYNHPDETNTGWPWQTCSEMVIPIGRGKNDTMFPAGSHCLDILSPAKTDPEWLVEQRNTEMKIIHEWINKYYAELHALKK